MMRWDSLRLRLPFLIAFFTSVAALLVGLIVYVIAERAIIGIASREVSVIRDERSRALKSWIDSERMALAAFAARSGPREAIEVFSAEFALMDDVSRGAVIAAYTTSNTFPAGARAALDSARDGSRYSARHGELHPGFREFAQIRRLHDLIFVNASGDVVYSVAKEMDFGTNFLNGPYKQSAAGRVFATALANNAPGTQVLVDMELYEPSKVPGLFLAQAVRGRSGEAIGVILFQLKLDRLRETVNDVNGLGESGDVYLVGTDQVRRSEARLSSGKILEERIETVPAERAAAGSIGVLSTIDYRGVPVIAAHGPVDLGGVKWGIIAKLDMKEATASLRPVLTAIAVIAGLIAFIAAFVGFGVARRMTQPLESALNVMRRLSTGDLQVDVPAATGLLEVRQIIDALGLFRTNLVENERLLGEVRKLSAQFVSFLETTPDLVSIRDRQLRYVAASQALARQLGVKSWRDLIGYNTKDIGDQSASNTSDAEILDVMTGRVDSVETEETSIVEGAEVTRAIKRVRIVDAGGDVVGVLSVSRNVTRLKQAEKAMAAARDAAEAADRAKSDFLASMSHEIRTPMNGITGMAELLSQTELNEEQAHMVRTIRDSGNGLITIINDILDFSKIEAGKLELEDIGMNLVDAIEGVATTLTPAAAKKGIRVHVFCDPAIPAAVHGDPTRVRQMLFNLGGNAIKFSNGQDVSIRAVRVDGDLRLEKVRFEVIDRGIGISKENQAKLFKAFSQAESSTTRRYGGTGLGLAICKRLVDLMGGTIGVDSIEGVGSTFWVEIAFKPAEKSRNQDKPRDLHGLRVLLVESPQPRAGTLKAYIEHAGGECIFVAQRTDVPELLRKIAPSEVSTTILLIDLHLDHAAQLEFLILLKSSTDVASVPKVLLEDFQKRGPRISPPDIVTVDANPVIKYRIITSVAVAAGRASPQIRVEAPIPFAHRRQAPSVDDALRAGQLILLAEDNQVNQDVIRRQLALLGFTCEIANNGALAFDAYRRGRYALLLTDCHMPEMDGYELTGKIRAIERGTGKRLPIIAVTANALQGEAERCIAAGMDDYISKPIAMPALAAALQKWMPLASDGGIKQPVEAIAANPPSLAPSNETAAINPRVIKDMFGDDEVTFKEILDSFVEPTKTIIGEIAAAHRRRDAAGIKDEAHKLKSSARSVGATQLGETCAALELAGKASDWAKINKLIPQSEVQFRAVEAYIKSI